MTRCCEAPCRRPAALALYATGASGATILRADGVQITRNPLRVPPYVDGDQPGCSWLGVPHASASRGLEGAINWVPNPSFEQGTAAWRASAGPGASIRSFARISSWAASGRHSAHLAGSIANRQGSSIAMVSRPVPAVGGQEYTLRVTIKARSMPSGGRIALDLGWLDYRGAGLRFSGLPLAGETRREPQHVSPLSRARPGDVVRACSRI